MYALLLILRSLGPRKYVCLKIHSFKLTFFGKELNTLYNLIRF